MTWKLIEKNCFCMFSDQDNFHNLWSGAIIQATSWPSKKKTRTKKFHNENCKEYSSCCLYAVKNREYSRLVFFSTGPGRFKENSTFYTGVNDFKQVI